MRLGVCLAFPATEAAAADALALPQAGAVRAAAARRRADQMLSGIVQGGMFPHLRREAARALRTLDLPGYALGGLSVGEPKETTRAMLAAAVAELPADRPRYLMGVGSPEDPLMAIGEGGDLFDCTLPTRMARAGTLLTGHGRRHRGAARFPTEPGA